MKEGHFLGLEYTFLFIYLFERKWNRNRNMIPSNNSFFFNLKLNALWQHFIISIENGWFV